MLQKSEEVIKQRYVCAQSFLHVCLFVTPWTVTLQAPLPLVFSRQEYQSGLQFSPPGDLPDPEMEPMSPASLALAGRFFTTEPPQANLHISFCDPVRSQIKKKKNKGRGVQREHWPLLLHCIYQRICCPWVRMQQNSHRNIAHGSQNWSLQSSSINQRF